jgi:hypothetical protein
MNLRICGDGGSLTRMGLLDEEIFSCFFMEVRGVAWGLIVPGDFLRG